MPIRSTAHAELDEEPPWDAEPGPGDDFNDFKRCPVCHAVTGAPCVALNGRVVNGQPDGVATRLPRAHTTRKRRKGR
jgi:hypothetical protein